MFRKINALADRHGMLPAGATVLCAVSGGADSVCLLHVLKGLGRDLRLVCAHYNHRLRGPESDRDEAFVRTLCAELGIPLTVGGGDVAAFARETGMGIEEAARTLRYAFLEQEADGVGAGRIATAHTADDNAETLLLNLVRGTGLRGLGGIPPVRGRIVRPLLTVTRREVEAYLLENGLPHVEDSSNGRDDFARNRLRHAVLPVLAELNDNFLQNAADTARLNREDEAFLTALAGEFIVSHDSEAGRPGLPLEELLELPGPVVSRVFRILAGGTLSVANTEALFALCRSDNPSAELHLPGMTVRREYDKLIFGAEVPVVLRTRTVEPGEYLELPEAGLALRCGFLPSCKGFHSSFNTFFFQYEKICGKLLVKSRSEGETISLLGRQGTHSIKKLMIDAKIPRVKRGLVPVIADDLGPLALYGFGQAKRCAAVPGERTIKIELIPIEMKGAAAT
jgi:tRNA(Ile)-lysidine synthase